MDKVHIIKWSGTNTIHGARKDFVKATEEAKELNKKRSWFHRLCGDEYVVQTFNIK